MYTSLAANDFLVTAVTKDYFEPGAYSNITEAFPRYFYQEIYHNSSTDVTIYGDNGDSRGSYDKQLFSSVLEGYDTSTRSYEDLTPSECTKLYNTDFVSNHRNLFLITNHASNTTHNNTLLDMIHVQVRNDVASPSSWMCNCNEVGLHQIYKPAGSSCNPSELTSNVARGLPWRVELTTWEEVEIGGCKSERTVEKCKVQFSPGFSMVRLVKSQSQDRLVSLSGCPRPDLTKICGHDWSGLVPDQSFWLSPEAENSNL